MAFERFCPFCMSKNTFESDNCIVCGMPLLHQNDADQLPVDKVLLGRYLVGCAARADHMAILYTCYDLELDVAVSIREFFPMEHAQRKADGGVLPYDGNEQEFSDGLDFFLEVHQRLGQFEGRYSIANIMDCFNENGTGYIVMEHIKGLSLKDYISHNLLSLEDAWSLLLPVESILDALKSKTLDLTKLEATDIMLTDAGILLATCSHLHFTTINREDLFISQKKNQMVILCSLLQLACFGEKPNTIAENYFAVKKEKFTAGQKKLIEDTVIGKKVWHDVCELEKALFKSKATNNSLREKVVAAGIILALTVAFFVFRQINSSDLTEGTLRPEEVIESETHTEVSLSTPPVTQNETTAPMRVPENITQHTTDNSAVPADSAEYGCTEYEKILDASLRSNRTVWLNLKTMYSDINGNILGVDEHEYDENGRCVYSKKRRNNETENSTESKTYDELGIVLHEELNDSETDKSYTYIPYYDSLSACITTEIRDSSKKLTASRDYYFSPDGLSLEIRQFTSDGVLENKWIFRESQDGTLQSRLCYDSTDLLTRREERVYDENGRLVHFYAFDGNGSLSSRAHMHYPQDSSFAEGKISVFTEEGVTEYKLQCLYETKVVERLSGWYIKGERG